MAICDNCKHLKKKNKDDTTGDCFGVYIEDTTAEHECPHYTAK